MSSTIYSSSEQQIGATTQKTAKNTANYRYEMDFNRYSSGNL